MQLDFNVCGMLHGGFRELPTMSKQHKIQSISLAEYRITCAHESFIANNGYMSGLQGWIVLCLIKYSVNLQIKFSILMSKCYWAHVNVHPLS